MSGRGRSWITPTLVLLAAATALGACRKYEPIDVWDPRNPQGPAASAPSRPGPGAVERVPLGEPSVTPSRPPSRPSASAAPVVVPSAEGGVVTVQRGETLFAVSRRTGVPVRALIDANNLSPPYGLQAGQRITVPPNRFHEVAAGDTLYGISRRYGVAVSELVRENRLEAPYNVRLGERLKIPTPVQAPEPSVASLPPRGPAAPVVPPPPGAPAPVAPPPAAGPAPALPPAPPSRPTPPGVLVPPAPTPVPPSTGVPVPPPAPPSGFLVPPAAAPPPPPPPIAAPPPPPSNAAPPPVVALPPPPVDAGGRPGRFQWPLRGRVLTSFGPTGRGLHNDGVNIAAPRGTTVVAAESGVVAYAGNELRGFGNLLLIKHADGWITAYAHNDALLVKRGDRVRRGQPISRVGTSGNVTEPQLHFEIRRGSRAVDPGEVMEPLTSTSRPAIRSPPAVFLAARPDPG
ncbi:MAG: peptidoglycan DD-metalloendopeptidase family protein [Alphaproteobacteria bacterium]